MYDGHGVSHVADYLQSHLFDNILDEVVLLHILIIFKLCDFVSLIIVSYIQESSILSFLFSSNQNIVICCNFYWVCHGQWQPEFWRKPEIAIKKACRETDEEILGVVGGKRGGSTAVTAIVIDEEKLVVANVGDSRAVLFKKGKARQLSLYHEQDKEREKVERRGGFVSHLPGSQPAHSLNI